MPKSLASAFGRYVRRYLLMESLRAYLGMEVLDRAWANANLSEEEALRLAVDEVHRFRSGQA